MCDNRGGFLPFLNYGATEFFEHSEVHSETQSVKNASASARAELQDGNGSV